MTPTPSLNPQADVKVQGAWGRITIPHVVMMALIAAVVTVSNRCSSNTENLEAAQRQNFDALTRRLEGIETTQRATLERIERDASEAKNRDLIQDLKLVQIQAKVTGQ
jgi:hypothetical protein